MSAANEHNLGPARLLATVYALFALAAGARCVVQILTRFEQAPLAYVLSALAAAVYLVAAFAFARPGPRTNAIVALACTFELAGVLAVGTASVADPSAFADETVWSQFGSGYGFVPLLLPLAGLAWVWRRRLPEGEPA